MNQKNFRIKENSFLAKLAAIKLGSHGVAMVLGKTVHLHNISEEHFLQNRRLVKHELCHIRQYEQHGFVGFLVRYLWESVLNGYHNNKFEVEARKAEEET